MSAKSKIVGTHRQRPQRHKVGYRQVRQVINKPLIMAALKVWEIAHGFTPDVFNAYDGHLK